MGKTQWPCRGRLPGGCAQEALQNVELSTRLSRAIYQGGPGIAALEAAADCARSSAASGATSTCGIQTLVNEVLADFIRREVAWHVNARLEAST